ncbi:hypothetical protein EYF80_063715 [Liparis tanakae]|uniref:Uncharacterized protein n=1 Tax=Liparis tanakae TaxID=230148 RepID=A0A4Z2EBL4_9TELE|nr:hypothetical protein EYF80_063715 [Liparis tanakae]
MAGHMLTFPRLSAAGGPASIGHNEDEGIKYLLDICIEFRPCVIINRHLYGAPPQTACGLLQLQETR